MTSWCGAELGVINQCRAGAREAAPAQASPITEGACWCVIACLPHPPLAQREFERRADPKDKNAQALLEEMRAHVKKVA